SGAAARDASGTAGSAPIVGPITFGLPPGRHTDRSASLGGYCSPAHRSDDEPRPPARTRSRPAVRPARTGTARPGERPALRPADRGRTVEPHVPGLRRHLAL